MAIHAFWLVAFAVADRIAISPPSGPTASEISLICDWAMPSAVAWLMNRSRQFGWVSESYVTTFAPAWRASLRAPQIASLSLADTMMTSVFCWDRVLM